MQYKNICVYIYLLSVYICMCVPESHLLYKTCIHRLTCVGIISKQTYPQAHRSRHSTCCNLARQRKAMKALPNQLTSASQSQPIPEDKTGDNRAVLHILMQSCWLNCLNYGRLPPQQEPCRILSSLHPRRPPVS